MLANSAPSMSILLSRKPPFSRTHKVDCSKSLIINWVVPLWPSSLLINMSKAFLNVRIFHSCFHVSQKTVNIAKGLREQSETPTIYGWEPGGILQHVASCKEIPRNLKLTLTLTEGSV